MEHSCTKCDWMDFDNQRQVSCPVCGAPVTNHFDESPERDERDVDREDEWE
jgi:uncharacterized Zn finger protein (UPF0148 family)